MGSDDLVTMDSGVELTMVSTTDSDLEQPASLVDKINLEEAEFPTWDQETVVLSEVKIGLEEEDFQALDREAGLSVDRISSEEANSPVSVQGTVDPTNLEAKISSVEVDSLVSDQETPDRVSSVDQLSLEEM